MGLNTDITQGIFDRFRSMPIARSAPLSGAILGDMFRYVTSFAVLFAYGSLLGFRVQTNVGMALAGVAILVAFAFALCWVWALLGFYVPSPAERAGLRVHYYVSADVRQQRVRDRPVPCRVGCRRGLR